MRHCPNGYYYWIGHYVVLNLSSKVFTYFGPPKLLQLDNGREFINSVIDNLVKDWLGEVTIING